MAHGSDDLVYIIQKFIAWEAMLTKASQGATHCYVSLEALQVLQGISKKAEQLLTATAPEAE